MNVELLEATMQHIIDHPEDHNQRTYLDTFCGTSACFAGWACLLSGMSVEELKKDYMPRSLSWPPKEMSIPGTAMRLLGLDVSEAAVLFDAGNTRHMLELIKKDLVNGDRVRDPEDYRAEAHPE